MIRPVAGARPARRTRCREPAEQEPAGQDGAAVLLRLQAGGTLALMRLQLQKWAAGLVLRAAPGEDPPVAGLGSEVCRPASCAGDGEVAWRTGPGGIRDDGFPLWGGSAATARTVQPPGSGGKPSASPVEGRFRPADLRRRGQLACAAGGSRSGSVPGHTGQLRLQNGSAPQPLRLPFRAPSPIPP